MWLSDFISKDEILKDSRVMTFGYDTKYRSKKQMWIEDHGDSFLTELDKARKTPKERDRPLVIIGHSFGGTIVTHAYVRSSEKTELEHIYNSITDIFLFGVPFQGINLDDVRSMVEEISDPTGQGEKMIECIAYETSRHTTILDVFKNRIRERGTRIFSFFETEKTPKVVKQEDGTFGRTGDLIIVVDRDSVKLGLEPLEKLFRAEGNHSTMVKLGSSQDPTYTTIQSYLKSSLEGAKHGVGQWRPWKRQNHAFMRDPVLRGLIFSLILQDGSLGSHIQQVYDQVGQGAFEGINSWFQLSKVFDAILSDLIREPTNTVYLVIDALDECVSDLEKLLDLISKFVSTSSSPQIKWIVSSRNWSDIERKLALPASIGGSRLSLELNSSLVSRAVEAYIGDQVLKLWPSERDEEFRNQVCKQLVEQADGTFLWVSLVVKDLEELQVKDCGSFLTVRQNTIYFVHQSAKDFLLEENSFAAFFRRRPKYIHYSMFSYSLQVMSKSLRKNIYSLPRPDFEINNDLRIPKPDPLASVRYSCTHWVGHFLEGNYGDDCFSNNDDYHTILDFLHQHFLHWVEALSLMGMLAEGLKMIESLLFRCKNLAGTLPSFIYDAKRFIMMHQSITGRIPLQLYSSCLLFSPKQSMIRQQNWGEVSPWINNTQAIQENWDLCLQTFDEIIVCSRPRPGLEAQPVRILGSRSSKPHEKSCFVTVVFFSPDGKLLAFQKRVRMGFDEFDESCSLWDVGMGKLQAEIRLGKVHKPQEVIISPDGRFIASVSYFSIGGGSGGIALWNTTTGALHTELVETGWMFRNYICVCFSPDSKFIAYFSQTYVGLAIKIWDIATKSLHAKLSADFSYPSQFTFIVPPDGKFLALLKTNYKSLIDEALDMSQPNDIISRFHYTIQVLSTDKGALLAEMVCHGTLGAKPAFAFSPDGRLLAYVSSPSIIKLWDAIMKIPRGELKDSLQIESFSISPSNELLACCLSDHTISLWNLATETLQARFQDHSASISSISFSPDSALLASSSKDGTLRVWDTSAKALHTELAIRNNKYYNLTICVLGPDGTLVACCHASDSTLGKFWLRNTSLSTVSQVPDCEFEVDYITKSLFLSPNNRFLMSWHSSVIANSGTPGDTINLWNTNGSFHTRLQLGEFMSCDPSVPITNPFSPDSTLLAFVSYRSGRNGIGVWSTGTGALQTWLTFRGFHRIMYLSFSPNSELLAFHNESSLFIWDIVTKSVRIKFSRGWTRKQIGYSDVYGGGSYKHLAFSHHSNFLAFSSVSGTWLGSSLVPKLERKTMAIEVWDLGTGALQSKFARHAEEDTLTSISFSPNGMLLAASFFTGSSGSIISLWDALTGDLKVRVGSHTGEVDYMFLSPDDRLLISCSKGDSTIKFWDVAGPASQGTSHSRGPLRFLTPPPRFRLQDIRVDFKTRAMTLLLELGRTFFIQF
ncbi:hypothetical protein TWF192_010954 [Orbilia oligospora]|nr:hypothetical protein TWF192_010954 [Orbilia oligospora]